MSFGYTLARACRMVTSVQPTAIVWRLAPPLVVLCLGRGDVVLLQPPRLPSVLWKSRRSVLELSGFQPRANDIVTRAPLPR